MAVIDRRRIALGGLVAALHALTGCGLDLRAIVVEAGDAAAPPDGADAFVDPPDAFDAAPTDEPAATDRAEGDAPDEPADATATPDATAPDATATPDATAAPDATDATPACAAPRGMCDGRCVDLSSDPSRCGACGNRCAGGDACAAGRCVGGIRAGALCTMPAPRGGDDRESCGADFVCLPTETTPVCTRDCRDSASQATERSMCGGAGSTCLTQGQFPDAQSFCARACTPGAPPGAAGSCRSGYVCTGWWFTTSEGLPDDPGCAAFCTQDLDCAGQRCNVRTGLCGPRPFDPAALPDGAPCNPSLTETPPGEMFPRNTQCRGDCFQTSQRDTTRGLCGSYLDVQVSTACPDDPVAIAPDRVPGADDLALCVVRGCRHTSECRAPLVCRYDEYPPGTPDLASPTSCLHPTSAQRTGLP